MAECRAAREQCVAARVVGGRVLGGVHVAGELLVGESAGDDRPHELLIIALHLAKIRDRTHAVVHLDARAPQAVGDRFEDLSQLASDRRLGIVEPGEHPVVAQCPSPRRWQRELPSNGTGFVGSREHLERRLEIAGVASQRSRDSEVGVRQHPRWTGDVAPHRDHAVGRLVAVHAAVVGGVADRAAESLPSSSVVRPAASAAAEPPEEPPGERAASHGLLVVPKIAL